MIRKILFAVALMLSLGPQHSFPLADVFRYLHPAVAPIKAAVLPLVKKDGMPELATSLYHDLRKRFPVFYDDAGAIGRRYRRQDEIGTPYCITIDFESLEDQAVTIRDRDSMAQERIAIDQVEAWLAPRLLGC